MEAMVAAERWRRSRDLEAVGMAVFWLRSMLDDKASLPTILKSMPGYDGEGLP